MKICFSRLDKMGDMILTLPAIKAIKINNPDYKIYVLASQNNIKILNGIKYIDEIIFIDTTSNFKYIWFQGSWLIICKDLVHFGKLIRNWRF